MDGTGPCGCDLDPFRGDAPDERRFCLPGRGASQALQSGAAISTDDACRGFDGLALQNRAGLAVRDGRDAGGHRIRRRRAVAAVVKVSTVATPSGSRWTGSSSTLDMAARSLRPLATNLG